MPDTWDNFESMNNPPPPIMDIELLKREVGQRFPFYDSRFNNTTAMFFCRIDEESLEEKFDSLRVVLREKGYIPMLRLDKGEHIIYIIKKPVVKRKPIWINLILLVATIFTTTLAGAIQWIQIYEPTITDFFTIIAKSVTSFYFLNGFLFFSLPLLLILGIHEMGHYLVSKKHGLDTSLPYFIPLPPPFILGTFGAVISTKEPIPNRKTLLDVGVSGPLCGFLVAIVVSFIGFMLMQQNPITAPQSDGTMYITLPLILQGIESLFALPTNAVIHPTLFAGWVGIFLTAVNLLPIGQLDGGHISRALLKDKHKYFSWFIVIVLLLLGLFYEGWLIFAFLVLFLIGTQHQPPLNELSPLDTKRKLIGVLALIVFIVCFAPIPIAR
ncbi:MAG: site-2 protease family protein [Methanobacteriota archaeon]